MEQYQPLYDHSSEFSIEDFSGYLFWDVDKNNLDLKDHAAYIIKRVLEYGQLNDWHLIKSYYTIPFITEIVKKFSHLDKRALSFISVVSKTPIEEFRCYMQQQLSPPHWSL